MSMHQLLLILALGGGTLGQVLQCPHPQFRQRHVCDTCGNEFEVRDFLRGRGEQSIVEVFGPPHTNRSPLYRPIGLDPRDSCVNRQPRPAYRCNMGFRRPYCFRIGYHCYGGHSSLTGQLDSEFISCQDNYAWSRQHQMDDYETDRQSDPEVQ